MTLKLNHNINTEEQQTKQNYMTLYLLKLNLIISNLLSITSSAFLDLQASQAHPSRGIGKHATYKNHYYY